MSFGLVYQVPQSHCVIIERFGKFSRVVQSGLHIRLPLIEKQKNVIDDCGWGNAAAPVACRLKEDYTFIELTDQHLDTKPRIYHTKDNIQVSIDAVIFWRIVDVKSAVYAVDNLITSMIDTVLNALRSEIGSKTLEEILTGREKLSSSIAENVAVTAQRWGVSVQRVEIQELKTDDATADAMRLELEAERKKRAAILEAEGAASAAVMKAEAEKKAVIIAAEAEKTALILRAEGAAAAKELQSKADSAYLEKLKESGNFSAADIVKVMLAQKYLEGYEIVSKNPADKVYLPVNGGNVNVMVGEKE